MAILFNRDWQNYPNAIPHYSTQNTTWLEYASLLEQANVRNCLFHLALHNPELEHVDPHDPNLPYLTKLAITIECKANPWYFWREVVRVPAATGSLPKKLRANRAIISLFWSLLNSFDYYLEQIRQTGKTAGGEAFSLWYHIFGTENTRTTLFTKGDLIKEIIMDLKKFRKGLPSYLVKIAKDDTDNQNEFTNMAHGNRMVAVRPQKEEEAANQAGRGIRTPFNIFDECPFLWNIHITLPAAAGGMGEASKQALAENIPTANLFSSTPGMLNTEEGEYCHDILMSGYKWNESLLDAVDRADAEKIVIGGSSSLKPLITGRFTHTHMGITDDELRRMIANARTTDRNKIKRDFLLQWSSGTLTHPLDAAILEKITRSNMMPLYSDIHRKEGYTVRWYIEKEEVERGFPDRHLVMGLDASEIIGRDNIAGVMIDVSTLEVVGAFTIGESMLPIFSVWLAKFLAKYQNITLVPESKNTWVSIRDTLLTTLPSYGIDPGRRIYSKVVDSKDGTEQDRAMYEHYSRFDKSQTFYQRYRKYFGYMTGSGEHSRELLYGSNMQEAAKRTAHTVRDEGLINELSGLVEKNNRVDHQSGRHDDHVVAWLLAHWFLTYARNLSHYGIDPVQVKRDVYRFDSDVDWKTERRKNANRDIKDRIHDTIAEINDVHDDAALIRLEARLIGLYEQLDDDDDPDISSMSTVIAEAKERRSRSRTRARLETNRADRKHSPGRLPGSSAGGRFDRARLSANNGKTQFGRKVDTGYH